MMFDRHASLRPALAGPVLALAACLLPGSAHALFTVNFDADGMGDPIVHGQVIDDEYTLANGGIVDGGTGGVVGMTVSALNGGGGPDLGVAFDTTLGVTEDPDLQDPFTVPTNTSLESDSSITNPGNILIVQENSTGCGDGVCDSPDDEGGGPNTFTFTFSDAVTLFSVDVFDVDGTPDKQKETVAFVLRDSAGASIFETTNLGTGGDNTAARVEFGTGIMNVAALEATFSSSGALSNIKGEVPSNGTPPTSVSAPGSLALLALGLAGAAASRRRRG